MQIITIDNIVKYFKRKKILDHLSLSIKEGEIFGIVGRSGCGKTTLLKILLGMLDFNSGKMIFRGRRIHSFNKNLLKEGIGFASQESMLYEELTLRENISYFGSLYGLNKSTLHIRADKLVRFFGLQDFKDSLIRTFSGGMKKRANILVALAHDPAILILDEPTAGLDPILRDAMWVYIKELNSMGKTIVVTSHLLDELQDNCTTIGFMHTGKIERIIDLTDKSLFNEKSLNTLFREWIEK